MTKKIDHVSYDALRFNRVYDNKKQTNRYDLDLYDSNGQMVGGLRQLSAFELQNAVGKDNADMIRNHYSNNAGLDKTLKDHEGVTPEKHPVSAPGQPVSQADIEARRQINQATPRENQYIHAEREHMSAAGLSNFDIPSETQNRMLASFIKQNDTANVTDAQADKLASIWAGRDRRSTGLLEEMGNANPVIADWARQRAQEVAHEYAKQQAQHVVHQPSIPDQKIEREIEQEAKALEAEENRFNQEMDRLAAKEAWQRRALNQHNEDLQRQEEKRNRDEEARQDREDEEKERKEQAEKDRLEAEAKEKADAEKAAKEAQEAALKAMTEKMIEDQQDKKASTSSQKMEPSALSQEKPSVFKLGDTVLDAQKVAELRQSLKTQAQGPTMSRQQADMMALMSQPQASPIQQASQQPEQQNGQTAQQTNAQVMQQIHKIAQQNAQNMQQPVVQHNAPIGQKTNSPLPVQEDSVEEQQSEAKPFSRMDAARKMAQSAVFGLNEISRVPVQKQGADQDQEKEAQVLSPEAQKARYHELMSKVYERYEVVGDRFYDKRAVPDQKTGKTPVAFVFNAENEKLATKSTSQKDIEAMTTVAAAHGWEKINVSGHPDFKKKVWLEASLLGIKVEGYKPTAQDTQELETRKLAQQRSSISAPVPTQTDKAQAPAQNKGPDLTKSPAPAQTQASPSIQLKKTHEQPSATHERQQQPTAQKQTHKTPSADDQEKQNVAYMAALKVLEERIADPELRNQAAVKLKEEMDKRLQQGQVANLQVYDDSKQQQQQTTQAPKSEPVKQAANDEMVMER